MYVYTSQNARKPCPPLGERGWALRRVTIRVMSRRRPGERDPVSDVGTGLLLLFAGGVAVFAIYLLMW